MELTQRFLVNRQVRSADGEVSTKYAFPFWDRDWRVVLTVLDRFGAAPAIAPKPIFLDAAGRVTVSMSSKDLEPVDRWNPETLRHLFHYDPWWAFRGMGGVQASVKAAILPTNIARSFHAKKLTWKVHDVEFSSNGESVKGIVAKDPLFHPHNFTKEDLDLEDFRPKSSGATRGGSRSS